MGWGQSKSQEQNVAVAQAVASSNNVEDKINNYGIILIVIVVLLAAMLVYALHTQCRRKVRGWLRKEVVGLGLTPVIKVQPIPQQPQQQATTTVY